MMNFINNNQKEIASFDGEKYITIKNNTIVTMNTEEYNKKIKGEL
jgi:hypothetical protein